MPRSMSYRPRPVLAAACLALFLGETSEPAAQTRPAAAQTAAPPAPPTAPTGATAPTEPTAPTGPAPTAAPAVPAVPPALVPPAKQAVPHESFQMHNGLRVILQQDSRLPFVTVCVVYHVGAYDEEAGKSGLAHLFEHLMFEGSRGTLPRNAFHVLSEMGGVDANGTTSWDQTVYYETIPAINLESALWMEADRMENLTGAENTIHQEEARSIVKNERRQRYETVPYASAYEALAMRLFAPTHPYSRYVIGSFDDLDRVTTKDLREFYKTWYGPNNATLVIVGDVAPGEARRLVSQYFGPLQRRGTPLSQPRPAALSGTAARVRVKDGLAAAPALILGWATPPIDSQEDRIADVTAIILQSRLQRRLVRTLGLASQVLVDQQSRVGQSLFQINLILRSINQLSKTQGLADAVLDELRQDTVSDDEVAQAKLGLVTDRYWDLEDPVNRARSLARWTRFHNGVDQFRETLAGYQRITTADVARFARETLRAEARVAVEVEPTRRQDP